MSWLSDLFNPPAANIPLPQTVPFTGTAPTPFGYTPPSAPSPFAPTGFSGAESGMLGGVGGLSGFNLYNIPAAQGITGGLINDPNALGFQTGAGTAAGLGESAAMGAFGAGAGLYGLGGQIAQTAFDPQSALYNRTVQRLQDQTRAGLEARGVDMSPYGAGVEADALKNFNIDWQNQQLQRMISGGQAAGGLFGQGAGLQAGAPGQFLNAAGMPYGVSQGIGRGQMGALGALGQFGQGAAAIPQQQIGDLQNYLQWATTQQGMDINTALQLYTAGLGGQQQAFNQQQAAGFTDPMQAAQYAQGQGQQQFQNQLNQNQIAWNQQQQMFRGLGGLAGAGLGFGLGGIPGAMLGFGVGSGTGFGGGGGGGGFGGYGGYGGFGGYGGYGGGAPSGWQPAPYAFGPA